MSSTPLHFFHLFFAAPKVSDQAASVEESPPPPKPLHHPEHKLSMEAYSAQIHIVSRSTTNGQHRKAYTTFHRAQGLPVSRGLDEQEGFPAQTSRGVCTIFCTVQLNDKNITRGSW